MDELHINLIRKMGLCLEVEYTKHTCRAVVTCKDTHLQCFPFQVEIQVVLEPTECFTLEDTRKMGEALYFKVRQHMLVYGKN